MRAICGYSLHVRLGKWHKQAPNYINECFSGMQYPQGADGWQQDENAIVRRAPTYVFLAKRWIEFVRLQPLIACFGEKPSLKARERTRDRPRPYVWFGVARKN